MENRIIKIYGERNTGTNYLSKLIELNLHVVELPGVLPKHIRSIKRILPEEFVIDAYFFFTFRRNLGWKHALVQNPIELAKYPVCADRVHFITISKNPYSWLLSLYRRPYHHHSSRNVDFETFLESQWITVRREKAPRILSSPIELWNIKNAAYLQLMRSFPTMNIRYEDLLQSPEQIMRRISIEFTCAAKRDNFKNYDSSAKGHDRDSDYYKNYYLGKKWRGELSERSIKIINAEVDESLMEHFSYEILTS